MSIDRCQVFLDVNYKAWLKWVPKNIMKSTIKRRPPWLTFEILELIRNKTQLLKLNQTSSWRNTKLVKDYKFTQGKIKKECKNAK